MRDSRAQKSCLPAGSSVWICYVRNLSVPSRCAQLYDSDYHRFIILRVSESKHPLETPGITWNTWKTLLLLLRMKWMSSCGNLTGKPLVQISRWSGRLHASCRGISNFTPSLTSEGNKDLGILHGLVNSTVDNALDLQQLLVFWA